MIRVSLLDDCQGAAYMQLVQYCSDRAAFAYLVDQFGIYEAGNSFYDQTHHLVLRTEAVREWPGTTFSGPEDTLSSARLLTFPVSAAVTDVILHTCESLFEWSRWRPAPVPEDLGFMRRDGSVLLASISHEHEAWLELTIEEFDDFQRMAHEARITYAVEP